MIISTISWGSLFAGDKRAAEVSGDTSLERILLILALVRYQSRIANSSIAGDIMTGFNRSAVSWKDELGLPESEDVGVFVVDIAESFQGFLFGVIRLAESIAQGCDPGIRGDQL
jgi:hypothetical protein